MDTEESEWYVKNNCEHSHCPYDCEHPQPFIYNGNLICGHCFFIDEIITFMIPCTPETCKE